MSNIPPDDSQGSPKYMRTKVFPVHATKSGLNQRTEKPLTASKFKDRYLLGIPKAMPNGDKLTDSILNDKIMLAMNEVELLIGMPVEPLEYEDSLPFDLNLYKNFVHCKTLQGPIQSVQQLCIRSSDGVNLFNIPPEWIDPGQFDKRQVNVIPYLSSAGVLVSNSAGGAGTFFLATIGSYRWLPSYWTIKYTAGLGCANGELPVPVNDLIGTVAAINILSLLGPTNQVTSQSLSQDNISQSSNSAGVNRYQLRIDELKEHRDELVKKIKGIFSRKYYAGSL